MRLTRAQIEATIHPGDVVLVHYEHGGVVAAGIQFWTNGLASHVLNCLGGLEVVEEDIGGAMHSFIDTYMQGQCTLTVKRTNPPLNRQEQEKACEAWMGLVGSPYGFGSIARSVLAVPLRRYVVPAAPRLGRFLLRLAGHLVGHQAPDCSASWVVGMRAAGRFVLRGYDPEDVTPETIMRDGKLEVVAVWRRPILNRGGR